MKPTKIISAVIFPLVALFFIQSSVMHAEEKPAEDNAPADKSTKTELATFGGGCFWCVEAVFERLDGVKAAVSGYEGGHVKNPTYRAVCEGTTGHAEVVRVEFDPTEISYNSLLEWFFKSHDPTTLNRQGADRGTQYRSAIFTHGEAQQKAAKAYVEKLTKEKVFDKPITTQIEASSGFFAAEPYHQDYFENNPNAGYCRVVIEPKINKLFKADKTPKK